MIVRSRRTRLAADPSLLQRDVGRFSSALLFAPSRPCPSRSKSFQPNPEQRFVKRHELRLQFSKVSRIRNERFDLSDYIIERRSFLDIFVKRMLSDPMVDVWIYVESRMNNYRPEFLLPDFLAQFGAGLFR